MKITVTGQDLKMQDLDKRIYNIEILLCSLNDRFNLLSANYRDVLSGLNLALNAINSRLTSLEDD